MHAYSSFVVLLTLSTQVHVRSCHAIADVDVERDGDSAEEADDGFGPTPSQRLSEHASQLLRTSQARARSPLPRAITPEAPLHIEDMFSPLPHTLPDSHQSALGQASFAGPSQPLSLKSRASHESSSSSSSSHRRLPTLTPVPANAGAAFLHDSGPLPPSSMPSTAPRPAAPSSSPVGGYPVTQEPLAGPSQPPPSDLHGSSFTPLPEHCPLLPGPETVMSGNLEKWGIVINTVHRVVICLACKRCIPRKEVASHLKHHRICGVTEALVSHTLDPYKLLSPTGSLVPDVPPGNADTLAIYGLDVIQNAHFCVVCKRGFASQKSLNANHFSKPEVACSNVERISMCCAGQTFFNSNRRYVFPVTVPAVTHSPSANTPFSLFLKGMPKVAAPEYIVPPANDRTVSPYLSRLNWLPFVHNIPTDIIHKLVDFNPHDTVSSAVLDSARAYIKGIVKELGGTSPDILRQMVQFNKQT